MTDVGEYCRQVESHLTRVNGGHLVRVVGPGFVLVRQWAEEGIPLSAVFRGIDQKVERHRAGASKRPLRIEFCDADVREVYEAWRRAVGVTGVDEHRGGSPDVDKGSGSARRSVSRDLARAMDRLVTLAGRLDLPDALRLTVNEALDAVGHVRDHLKSARGDARVPVLAPLADWDRRLMTAALAATPPGLLAAIEAEAVRDLESFRSRLAADAWQRAVAVTVERAVRSHFQLPDLADLAG